MVHLTEKQVLALNLFRLHGSVGRVAELMGISRPSASRLLSRARENHRIVQVICATDGGLKAIEDIRRILKV